MVTRQEIKQFSGRRRWRFIASSIEQYKTKLWIMHMEMAYAVVTLIPEIQKKQVVTSKTQLQNNSTFATYRREQTFHTF